MEKEPAGKDDYEDKSLRVSEKVHHVQIGVRELFSLSRSLAIVHLTLLLNSELGDVPTLRATPLKREMTRRARRTNCFVPFSQEVGAVATPPPPLRIFSRTIFAFLLSLPFRQYTHPLSRYPCIYEKNFKDFYRDGGCRWGGGGGLQQRPPPPS